MARIDLVIAFARQIWLREYWWAEFFSAIPLLGWAVWAMVSPGTVNARPAFVETFSIMPSRCWQLLSVVVAAAQFAGLFLDLRWLRATAAGAAAWVIGTMTLALWLSVPSSLLVYMLTPVGVDLFALWRHIRRAP